MVPGGQRRRQLLRLGRGLAHGAVLDGRRSVCGLRGAGRPARGAGRHRDPEGPDADRPGAGRGDHGGRSGHGDDHDPVRAAGVHLPGGGGGHSRHRVFQPGDQRGRAGQGGGVLVRNAGGRHVDLSAALQTAGGGLQPPDGQHLPGRLAAQDRSRRSPGATPPTRWAPTTSPTRRPCSSGPGCSRFSRPP